MELSGHSGEVFAAKFDPTGSLIASGSMDRSIRASFTSFHPLLPSHSANIEWQCCGTRPARAITTVS